MTSIRDRINNITQNLNSKLKGRNMVNCKEYIKVFEKKINSVLYPENFDQNAQLFIPIKGECYNEVKNYMIESGFTSFFKNERFNKDSDCNCIKLFMYKNKLYFIDWECDPQL